MDIEVGSLIRLKKNHPCGSNLFRVARVGMDFKLVCENCGREIILPRSKAEKSIKKVEAV